MCGNGPTWPMRSATSAPYSDLVSGPRLAAVGHVCVDMRVPTQAFPEAGRLVETPTIDLVLGGSIGNFGRVLRAVGESAYSVGRLGTDALGDIALAGLRTWADTRFMTHSTTSPTSGTVVFVLPDGERSFIHASGANAEFATEHLPIERLAALGVTHLHLGYAMLLPAFDGASMANALWRARALGITTSLDITWDPTGGWMRRVGPLLPHVDIFCPNDAEAEALTGESDPQLAARALLDAGVRRLAVVTLGAGGVLARWPDGRTIRVDAPAVEVRDTTGAGDCFYAGLHVALLRGDDDESAVRFATEAASAAISVDQRWPGAT